MPIGAYENTLIDEGSREDLKVAFLKAREELHALTDDHRIALDTIARLTAERDELQTKLGKVRDPEVVDDVDEEQPKQPRKRRA